jgi:hypothetical protein
MQARVLSSVAALAVLLGAPPLLAHHSFAAEFDASKSVKLRGTVTRMEWTNPHVWIYLDVPWPDEKTVSWAIEADAPNAMSRQGFRTNVAQPGTVMVVEGYRAKNGTSTAKAMKVSLPDGHVLFVRSPERPQPPK